MQCVCSMLAGIFNKKEEIPYEKVIAYNPELPIFLIYFGMPGMEDNENDKIIMHWHRSLEIIDTRSSTSVMTINGETVVIPPDHIQIINSRDIHGVKSEECSHPYKGVTFQLSYDFLKERIPNIDSIRFSSTNNGELRHVMTPLLGEIFSLYQEDKTKNTPIIYALCDALVQMLIIYGIEDKIASKVNDSRFNEMLSWIEKHYSEDINFYDMAEQFHVSYTLMNKLFNKYVTYSPKSYVQKLRVQKSIYALANHKKSITEIAWEYGFASPDAYIRTFKKEKGVTPAAFRKMLEE